MRNYVMSYMAQIYGVIGMTEHIDNWKDSDFDYRRALDSTSSRADAPLHEEYRRFLNLTLIKSYGIKLKKIVDKFGSRPPYIMHLLAHTDPKWSSKSLGKLNDLYAESGISVDKDLRFAAVRARELRVFVSKKHNDLTNSVKSSQAKARKVKSRVKFDHLIEPVEYFGVFEDDADLGKNYRI